MLYQMLFNELQFCRIFAQVTQVMVGLLTLKTFGLVSRPLVLVVRALLAGRLFPLVILTERWVSHVFLRGKGGLEGAGLVARSLRHS